MSVGNSKLNINGIFEGSYEDALERINNFSQLVIPFSKICKSCKPADIYSGNESIPFKEREPEFKLILRQEFNDLKVT